VLINKFVCVVRVAVTELRIFDRDCEALLLISYCFNLFARITLFVLLQGIELRLHQVSRWRGKNQERRACSTVA
jgi:hypothetical protein